MKNFFANRLTDAQLDKVSGGTLSECYELWGVVEYDLEKNEDSYQFSTLTSWSNKIAKIEKFLKNKCGINAALNVLSKKKSDRANDRANIYMKGKKQLNHKQVMYLARVAAGLDV